MVPVSYIVKSSQKISDFLYRHEPAVMVWDVPILQREPDVLTVCKLPSVPVHPCGQYRKNTVVGILQADFDFASLFSVHRLDCPISRLLILARNASKADIFRQQECIVDNPKLTILNKNKYNWRAFTALAKEILDDLDIMD